MSDELKVYGRDFNCGNCRFGVPMRTNPTDIKTHTVCKLLPPPIVSITVPGQGIGVKVMPRVVPESEWCFSHVPREGVPPGVVAPGN